MVMKKANWKLYIAATGLVLLILDSKTASYGASQGIKLCVCTVIPSLFPFIFMSSTLVGMLKEKPVKPLQHIGKIFNMPAETINCFLVGLLGGYPTGAACVAEHYRNGQIKKQQAEQMLGFCNNAGPAFLFGIGGALFSRKLSWILWIVHILSALLTFLLLPKAHGSTAAVSTEPKTTPITTVLIQSVKNMGAICGWIILFRVITAIFDRWFLRRLPEIVKITIYGILEISNGCCSLESVGASAISFLLFSCFLSLGGLCVTMQTQTVVAPLTLNWYIIGKCIQCLTGIILCGFLTPLLFSSEYFAAQSIFMIVIPSTLIYIIVQHFPKKTVDFPLSVIYTKEKPLKR